MITNEHIEQFIAQAHRYGDAKLMLCSSGNLSWRIGEEALISGTGSWVPTLGKEKSFDLQYCQRHSFQWRKTFYGKHIPFRYSPRTSGRQCRSPFPIGICHCCLLHEKQAGKLQRNSRNSLPCRFGNTGDSILSSRLTGTGESRSRSHAKA